MVWDFGSGFTVFPSKKRCSVRWPVWIFLSNWRWSKSLPHNPGTQSRLFLLKFSITKNKNVGMWTTVISWLLGFNLGVCHRYQLHIVSSCLLEYGCHLTCFCGGPQRLWHSGGSLSYIFQSRVIIVKIYWEEKYDPLNLV